jgi:branched-chain amino acid transport system substrate-binding protein
MRAYGLRMTLVMVLLGLFGAIGCSDDSDNGPDNGCDDCRQVTGLIKGTVIQQGYYYVAELLPFNGDLSNYGPPCDDGVQLAVSEINAAGGIKGKRLGIIRLDSETDPPIAQARMQEIAALSPVSGVIGAMASSCTIEAGKVAASAKIPVISPASTSPAIADLDDQGYVYRTCASDKYQGVVAAAAAEREGLTNVHVIHREDAYGNGLSEAFDGAFTGTATATSYDTSALEYWKAAVTPALEANPDAIFLIAFGDDGEKIINYANQTASTPLRWMMPDSLRSEDFTAKFQPTSGDNDLTGTLGTMPATPSGAEYAAFTAAYEAFHEEAPKGFAAFAYDATYLLAMAMELADDPDDGEQVKAKLAEGRTQSGSAFGPGEWGTFLQASSAGSADYQGAVGTVDFDDKGDVVSDFEEWTIKKDGSFETTRCWTQAGSLCE